MVQRSPRSRPDTLDRPRVTNARSATKPPLADAACVVDHGRTTVVLTREFAHPRTDVWSLLTDPGMLVRWSPFTADRNLSQVGRATLSMLDAGDAPAIPSVVFVADTLTTLEYSWADDTLTWTLAAIPAPNDVPAGTLLTRLTLRQTLANEEMASANAAGWHLCFDVATSVLDGHPVAPIRGMAAMDHGWAGLNRRYAARMGVKPTRMDGTSG